MLLRRHHLRRPLSVLHRLPLAFIFALLFLCANGILPYDNAVRLSVRFNTHKILASLFGPLRSDRWLLYEVPAFPLDWAHGDVGIILKTGYGTRERAVAWLEALPAVGKNWGTNAIGIGNVEENVVVVGDFDGEVHISLGREGADPQDEFVLKVHDVIGDILQSDQGRKETSSQQSISSSPRGAKYRTLGATIAAGEQALARNLSRSFGWELDAMKFIPALELAFRTMPHKKWYLIVDDDTYLIQPSMNLLLSHLDPDIPYYLGNAVGDYRQRFAHGGSAIALSRAAMHELFAPCNAPNLLQAQRESLTETWGDRLLAKTLLRSGIYIDEEASRFFNGEPPWASRLRKDRFCMPVTAFHRLSAPEEMREAGNVFRHMAEPVAWIDLWEIYGAPTFERYMETPLRPDWDHVGVLDEQTSTAEGIVSATKCWAMCKASKGCLAWTWDLDSSACHMSPWITVGKAAKGKMSGLHVEKTVKLAHDCL